jgi:manganese transport system ATP-binding protein
VDRAFPLSVRQVVTMGRFGRLGITRRARASDREAVEDALARVQLSDLAERPIGALSGGQRTRALLARALAQDAELLLLDEPFAGVDQRSEALIAGLLTQLARDGRSIVVSTHDLTTLPDRADRVILLARRLITVDTPEVALAPASLARAFQFPREERA